jgi:hypothetical protein
MPCVYISIAQCIWHFNLFTTSMQTIFQFKIWNLGKKPLSKWHMVVYQHICLNASTTCMRLCLWALVFFLGSWRFLLLFLERLKVLIIAFRKVEGFCFCSWNLKVLIFALRNINGFCSCFWMFKVFIVSFECLRFFFFFFWC